MPDWTLERLIDFRKKYIDSWNCNCKKPSNYYKKLNEIDELIKQKTDERNNRIQ